MKTAELTLPIVQDRVEKLIRTHFEMLTPGPDVAVHSQLNESMMYALLGSGKRLRPWLCYSTSNALNGGVDMERVDSLALAMEMIHTYSLVHDDLPSMDNDSLRRGRPTCHIRFGEANAILAGDALLTEAFHVLSSSGSRWGSEVALHVIQEVTTSIGWLGMVGGQAWDMSGETRTQDALERLHRMKTGQLIRACVRTSALVCGASAQQLRVLTGYAEHLGLAFQVMDDVLDSEIPTEQLGKTSGKDVRDQKTTFVALMGVERAREYAQKEVDCALGLCAELGQNAETLADIARFIVSRKK